MECKLKFKREWEKSGPEKQKRNYIELVNWRYSGGWVGGVNWKTVGDKWKVGGLNCLTEEVIFTGSNKFYGH